MPTAVYTPPPDKSITIRALLLAAVAEGRTEIRTPLLCADTRSALSCLAALGVKYSLRRNKITVEGRGLRGLAPLRALNAGGSGTLCRLLAGLLTGQTFSSVITGSGSLRGRPMDRIARPLGLLGAEIKTRRGRLPLAIKPSPLKGINYSLPIASAQVKSALLLAGLYAAGRTIIKEPLPSRDHTERLLEYFGAGIARRGRVITLKPGALKGRGLCVPGDFSSAAPFLAAALLCGRGLLIKNTGLNPTRLGLVRVLKRMGARIKLTVKRLSPEPAGDILVMPSALKAAAVKASEVPSMIDELPLLAVLAAAARGRTVIAGAGELRHKESDRISATLALLKGLGVKARSRGAGLEITGAARFRAAAVNSFGDHRIAMAAAAAGARAEGPVKITGAACVKKSYPGFFRDFGALFSCGE